MTVKTTWVCDGCDKEVSAKGGAPGDWKRITVTLDGFHGHPVPADYNCSATYELCPRCLVHLRSASSPRQWPRETPQQAAA